MVENQQSAHVPSLLAEKNPDSDQRLERGSLVPNQPDNQSSVCCAKALKSGSNIWGGWMCGVGGGG